MLKKEITYTNFNDDEVTEEFYFNLTTAEMFEQGTRNDLDKIKSSNDNNLIFDTYTKILKAAYGVKSKDGRRFLKQDRDIRELTDGLTFDEFYASEAYSKLFLEFMSNGGQAAAEFFAGMMPADMRDAARASAGLPQDHLEKAE